MKVIKLELTLEEVNGIINVLGQQPFSTVVGLITKIQQQATPQVKEQKPIEKVIEEVAKKPK